MTKSGFCALKSLSETYNVTFILEVNNELCDDRSFAVLSDLSEVVIELHYEGCYGKPGRGTERRRAPTLKPNSTAKARGPLILTKHARHKDRAHALRAVNVVAKGSHVVFDLSVDALELGVAVECPRRDPRRK